MCAKPQHRDSPLRLSRQPALTGPGSNGQCQGTRSLTVTALPCRADDVSALQLAGEIDLCTVEYLRECLDSQLAGGAYRGIVLDCTEVSFLAACGIGLLVEIVDRACLAQVQIRLVARSRAVLRALEVSGVNKLVLRADTVDEAIAQWAV